MQQYSKNANIYKYTKIHKMYNIKNARYTKKQIPRHTIVPQTIPRNTIECWSILPAHAPKWWYTNTNQNREIKIHKETNVLRIPKMHKC